MANLHLVTGYAGENHITAADQASLYAAVFGAGEYVLNTGNKLAAQVITNNQIRVSDGDIMMQGRHVRLAAGHTVDLTIENGAQGYQRNDLIVARYTKDTQTGVESCELVVIKGTAVASNPVDPAYVQGDLLNDQAAQNDMPLYRVPISGVNVQELVPLFTAIQIIAENKEHTHSANDITSGVLPMARGGLGSANGATGLKNLLAAGAMVLSENQYGDELPEPGIPGRIFFKKV